MKKQDFSTFKIACAEIYSLFSVPKGIKPRATEVKKYERLIESDKKTDEDIKYIREMEAKIATYHNDPPLSAVTINSLIKQYGNKIYNKKVATKGDIVSFLKKGTDMEAEAVELLSKIDNSVYYLQEETVENDYLIGKCDIICPTKVIDTKISWNVNTFLKAKTTKLSPKYWYQMQGYMELYDVDEAEVVFLLLNTPPELIEREKVKLANRFMIGEIDRDKYEIDLENIESAFTYSNIPIKRRYFRYKVKREPSIFETVYKKVEKARTWMQAFEKSMKNNILIVSSDKYLNVTEEDNPDSNPS